MIKRVLEMDFIDVGDKKFKLKVDNAKKDVDNLDVKALSDFIIKDKIFTGPVGDIVSLKEAYIRNTEIEKII